MWWKVDDLRHGAAPHNLMIDHPNGYASFYGHLLERPDLRVGQAVRQVDMIAKVGDPDVTCTSRPHLHLEIRNVDRYNHAYNPILLIDADWEGLALVGIPGKWRGNRAWARFPPARQPALSQRRLAGLRQRFRPGLV